MKTAIVTNRTDAMDWSAISTALDEQGWAILPKLLTAEECDAIAALYAGGEGFRSHIIMAKHGFGRGEYRYFSYPLPPLVQSLRTDLYAHLAPSANRTTGRRMTRVICIFPLEPFSI